VSILNAVYCNFRPEFWTPLAVKVSKMGKWTLYNLLFQKIWLCKERVVWATAGMKKGWSLKRDLNIEWAKNHLVASDINPN
jgi:hypothetical protein